MSHGGLIFVGRCKIIVLPAIIECRKWLLVDKESARDIYCSGDLNVGLANILMIAEVERNSLRICKGGSQASQSRLLVGVVRKAPNAVLKAEL